MRIDAAYGITKRLPNTTIAKAREQTAQSLSAEGFGVLTEIDVQATLKAKTGAEMEPYIILGACNPKLAHRALVADAAIGLLLPCNVVLATDGNDTIVSAASPRALFAMTRTNAELEAVATEAEERIRRALERVGT
jgi:uncharacterized protein (DUF302 family)